MDLERAADGAFAQDYAQARAKFALAFAAAGIDAKSYANPLAGPLGESLATDAAWVGPAGAARVLVLVSATHGVEGFCGSGAQIDWLGGARELPDDTALLLVHAINPHGFAWMRRVTEENVDLNRNFVDFGRPLPDNTGYEELAADLLPAALSGPDYEAAEARLRSYREENGEAQFQMARSGGQFTHPRGLYFGGDGPTWSRRTLEQIIAEHELAARHAVAVIDYHTGLGPFGYGEPICGHPPGSEATARTKAWYGDSVTEPEAGTSSTVVKIGVAEHGWEAILGDALTYIGLEFGTYAIDRNRITVRDDHWLHNQGPVDWADPQTERIKAAIRKQFHPATPDWKEMALFRSRQLIRQALAGLATG